MPKADPLFTLLSFLKYYQQARNAYGIHSPFIYQLYQKVIKKSRNIRNSDLEQQRKVLLRDSSILSGLDMGTGQSKDQMVKKVARKAMASSRFHSFLSLLADFLQADSILETGTSLGLSSAYLASDHQRSVHTIDGNGAILDRAKTWHLEFNIDNIQYYEGDLYELLPRILDSAKPDLIYHDADHRSQSVEFLMSSVGHYLPQLKAIVIHDIHWSRDMYTAWQRIVHNPQYAVTVDIFQAGIIFPQIETEKQHFIVKF